MVYLIGVDHLIQYNGPVPEPVRSEFMSYLVELCRELGITAIAEEFSEEALVEVYHATRETAREAARMLGIEHRYCDPEGDMLARLGIPYFGDLIDEAKKKYNAPPSYKIDDELRMNVEAYAADRARSYWHIREQYWLDQISDIVDRNILFICGHEHVARFGKLLLDGGCKCTIVETFWKEDLFSDYGKLGIT